MPRNVRNFWLELTVDGRTSSVGTGPRAKDGGFRLVILQRNEGGITRAMEIDGRALPKGRLCLTAELKGNDIVGETRDGIITAETER